MFDRKILIIDDDITVSTMVKLLLEDVYDVATATSALDAFKYLSANKVDLILLDIKMPHINGIEALEKIKKICPEVIVIMMSAYASAEHRNKARMFGACGYIAKPFDVDELRNYIDKVLLQNEGNELSV